MRRDLLLATQVVVGARSVAAPLGLAEGPMWLSQGAAVQNGGEGGEGFPCELSGVMAGGNPVVSTLTGQQNHLAVVGG